MPTPQMYRKNTATNTLSTAPRMYRKNHPFPSKYSKKNMPKQVTAKQLREKFGKDAIKPLGEDINYHVIPRCMPGGTGKTHTIEIMKFSK